MYSKPDTKMARRTEVRVEVAAELAAGGMPHERRRFLMEALEEDSCVADEWIIGTDMGTGDGRPDVAAILTERWQSDRGQLLANADKEDTAPKVEDFDGLTPSQRITRARQGASAAG